MYCQPLSDSSLADLCLWLALRAPVMLASPFLELEAHWEVVTQTDNRAEKIVSCGSGEVA